MGIGVGILIGVVIGLGIGFAISILFDKSKEGGDAAKVKKMEADHGAYRKQVDDHFVNTAVLFKGLTEQYRDVYQHISQGAGDLCSEEAKALQTDLVETALLVQPLDDAIEEPSDFVEPPMNTNAAEKEGLISSTGTNSADNDIPLAAEVEVTEDVVEELRNQASKKEG